MGNSLLSLLIFVRSFWFCQDEVMCCKFHFIVSLFWKGALVNALRKLRVASCLLSFLVFYFIGCVVVAWESNLLQVVAQSFLWISNN